MEVSTPSPRTRSRTSRPGSSSPMRLIQPAEMPSRERAMATFDSAPPILSSRPGACRSLPGLAGTPRTIVSPAVTTPGMLVRPDARGELVHEKVPAHKASPQVGLDAVDAGQDLQLYL